ncbi:unnamed protein product [Euphydryas editha]|uniref:Uncharacterized protein n=1 Tax=Euphydryas editha TaxID=104508 RepID=A0AAU9V781_EUPED|nr:unnamed protein product [Euphydryas editha]
MPYAYMDSLVTHTTPVDVVISYISLSSVRRAARERPESSQDPYVDDGTFGSDQYYDPSDVESTSSKEITRASQGRISGEPNSINPTPKRPATPVINESWSNTVMTIPNFGFARHVV